MFAPTRPILLIDVDGVLSLFGFDPVDPPQGFPVFIEGTPHWLSSAAGERLNRLAGRFDCVWCTGWEERAEDHLPRLLGLPGGWAHLRFDERRGREIPLGHWKLETIDAHVGRDAPLAWIDDAHDEACLRWAAARPGETLLVTTHPSVGLTEGHVVELEAWAARAAQAAERG